MPTEVEVYFKDKNKAKSFKKHLEMTHPTTRGNITLEHKKRKRIANKMSTTNFSNKLLNKSLKNSPDFPKSAAKFTKL